MSDEIILNKVAIIERCVQRIKEEYGGNRESLSNYTKQDSIVLNIQRACEASIDLAMHIVASKKLGVPQISREAFELLKENGVIGVELANRLKAMVGFRNIAVHDYQKINLSILEKIVELHIDDFNTFSSTILIYYRSEEK
ncbi:type VII toxin-antitoxin system HepT family RNase toxin [Bacillus sp. FJAT-45350]|uniref:type VII toxin-antitoxin system HepT family RNase toxin n=1 Tax=Bacillus sp. FJAT-45350 TaxID=2011014 RepID=UPI000BB83B01|nr:DUF86 domain-containing protein [Bacillus sp. FJAT-45350]